MTEIENNPHQALIEKLLEEFGMKLLQFSSEKGFLKDEGIDFGLVADWVEQSLQATIDTVLEAAVAAERERIQKNFSLAVHNTCRKHKPEELKALTTLLNEPCLAALTPLPDKE